MIVKWDGIKSSTFIITLFYIFTLYCYTPPIRKIPQFNYDKLLEKHYKENIKDPFPIIVQPSEENDLSVSDEGFMVFSSNEGENDDIWLRDLNSILKIKIIEHPAKQNRPFIKKFDKENYILLYVSNDQDIMGDIYLTIINPKQIFDLYINKRQQINFWNYSINISNYIENYYKDHKECKGKYVEDFPVISQDSKTIYFISNRCTNKYYLWKLSLKNFKPVGKPEILFNEEIYYLSINKDYLTFSILNNHQFSSKIGFLNLKSNDLKILEPQVLKKPLEGIIIKPYYNDKKNLIYCIYISKDTNGNQKLDPYDKGTLIAINLEGSVVSQILPNEHIIYDYNVSNYLDGSIFYIADNYLQKDIFLTKIEGNIPKQKDPFEQYELSFKYKNKNYDLALLSVITYFFNDKNYPLIEGYVLYDLIHYLKKNNEKDKLQYYELYLNQRKKENFLLSIFYQLRDIEVHKKYNHLKEIENQYQQLNIKDKFIHNYFFYQLGKVLWEFNPHKAIKYFEQITEDFTYYPDVSYYLFFYQYQYQKKPIHQISENLIKNAIKNVHNTVKISNLILSEFKKLNKNSLIILDENINNEFIKNYLNYSLAEKFYLENNLKDSLTKLNHLKNIDNNEYLYLKLKVLKLKINLYKKLGLEKELLTARNSFINAYKKEFNIEIDEEEIQSLINASNEFVKKYRKNAQIIYKAIEENIKEGINLLETNLIEIGVLQKDAIEEFCAPDSLAGKLIDDYNYPEYEKRYADLCKNLAPYKNSNKIPMELAFELNQLMYLASYAYANLINILFINLHQGEIFIDYHRKWSIYYHRLKVDLAVERFNYLLDWEEKRALFITKKELTNLLIEKDPFVGTIFNDLLYGYREVASKMAQETFEYSVLYGHAYTLIRKSIEREKFYDSLLRKGYTISNTELIKRKQNILLELKEAEYQLLYILTLEPTNEDAALLLSYLYAYIDYRKEQNILNSPGFIDRLFRFITRINPKKLTDKVFYRNLYSTTFPERLYEKNITILESTISLRKLESKNVSPEVYLNLANNYYNIYNYKKAIENYKNVEDKLYLLQDDLQKGLYYFYYAKSHFYEGNYDIAMQLFGKSYEYFNEIYQKKQIEYNTKKTQLKEKTGILDKLNLFQTKNLEKLKEEVQNLKLNLIAIFVYQALSKFYHNDYLSAIVDLNKAIEEIDSLNQIKLYNLYNFMALNYLYNFDFPNAIKIANIAIQEAKKQGLSRYDDIFIPQTVGGRFLGLFLNFGEDFTIIGESRIPHEISSLRSYEISLGIIQNAYNNIGDLEKLLNTIQEKKKVLIQKDLDVLLGKESYITLLNQEATLYYKLKQYETAFNLFQEAAKFSYKNNFSKEYFINFKNMFYVIFDEIENISLDSLENNKEKYINKLNNLNKILKKFKKEYYDIRKKEFISIRKTENPDYTLTDYDKVILSKQIEFELKDFYHIEALIFYYWGIIEKSNEKLNQSIRLLENLINSYKKEENFNILYYRIYINYLKTKIHYQKISEKNFSPIQKEISDIYPEFLEYSFITEFFELNQLYGDTFYLTNQCKIAIQYYNKAIEVIDNNIIYLENPYRIEPLIKKYIDCLWQEKQYKEIIILKEKFRYYITNYLFFNSKLIFENPLHTKLFNEIIQNILYAKQLKQMFIKKRLEKQNTKIISNQLEVIENKISQYKQELAKELKSYDDFIMFDQKSLFEGYDLNQFVYLWKDSNEKCISFFNNKIKATEILSIKDLDKCIFPKKEIAIIPDSYIYKFKLKNYYDYFKNQMNYIALRSSILDKFPIFINDKDDLKYVHNLNIFNHSEDTIIKDQDAKEINLTSTKYLLSLSSEGIGLYFKDNPSMSKVKLKENQNQTEFIKKYILMNYKENQLKNLHIDFIFDSTWLTYDFLRHLGVSTVEDTNGFIWGIIGYNEKNLISYKKQLAEEKFQLGIKYFKNDPHLALKYFSLSNSYYEDIKTKIYILGCLIRTNNSLKEQYNIQLLNEINKTNSKISLFRYYVMLIHSYAYIKDYEKLEQLINNLKNQYNELDKIKKLDQTIELLKELSLNKPNYNKIEKIINEKEFDTAFTDLIIQELYKHGFYYLTEKLSSQYYEYKEFAIKNKIHQSLLTENPNTIDFYLNQDYYDQELITWKYIVSKKIDYLIDRLRATNTQNHNFYNKYIKFYQVLEEIYNNKMYSLEKFICENNICENLTEMEKTILLFSSLESIPYDTNGIVFLNLQAILDSMYKASCFKGNIYLNKVISKYVEYEEYDKAFNLYKAYEKNYDCIWNNEGNIYIKDIAYTLMILRALQYKIDDKLILKFSSSNRELSILVGDFIKLLVEPENKINDVLKNFHWDYIPKKFYKNVYDILLQRFLNKNWIVFQNIVFLKDSLSLNYKDYYNQIYNNLNKEEEWINIIAFKSKFYKCSIKENRCIETLFNRFSLERNLNRYFYEEKYYQKNSINFEQLLDLYSKLFMIENPQKRNYLWINGIHKFAPIKIQFNTYFVFSINYFQFRRITFPKELNKIIAYNIYLSGDYQKILQFLIDFKNIFSTNDNIFYLTIQKEVDNQYNIYIDEFKKDRLKFPLYNQNLLNFKQPINSYGLYLLTFGKEQSLLFINNFYTPEETELINKLNKLYKNHIISHYNDVYFTKPYTNSLLN